MLMAGRMEPRPGEGRFDTLIRLLGQKDPQTRQEAAAMFCQVGKQAVPPLIREVLKPGKRSQHRVAILDVVQQIGGPLGFDEMSGLQLLLRNRALDVREKAERVIISLRPGDMPDTPEDLALERAFNPFLRPLPHRPRRARRPRSRQMLPRHPAR